jgi:hypothetical protein
MVSGASLRRAAIVSRKYPAVTNKTDADFLQVLLS